MRSFLKLMLISGTVAAGVYVLYPALKSGRRRLERGLREAERVAGDTRRALETAERAVADTEQVVGRLHRTVS